MSDKKKILVIQNIHDAGIKLLKESPNYEFEIIEDVNPEVIKKKNYWMWWLIDKNCKITRRNYKSRKKIKNYF